ncbi:MAG TPA: DUF1080 domain-containing protein [Sphingobacterium sp.]|nr:DUF1080 domain-containing protein [Sphingobacterium sp.]
MMNKKLIGAAVVSIMLFSCESPEDKTSADTDEVHHPASQTIPEEAEEFIGRWDLTLDKEGEEMPSWLEIELSGFSTLVGRYVSYSGSARPISHVQLNDEGEFSFSIPPQWEDSKNNLTVKGYLDGDQLKGTVTAGSGKEYNYVGVKAPLLIRDSEPEWGESIELFNGEDLEGWRLSAEKENWEVVDGVLTNNEAGANLISEDTFDDFKLEVEFRYPEGSNSGVYLRGRYELQIEDSPLDKHPGSLFFGGIYGFLSPNEMATLGPNEWQKMEVTLIGRLVTIVANGKEIITRQEIPGITGGALDSREEEPGPIYLQGDHGPVEFKSIKITPSK